MSVRSIVAGLATAAVVAALPLKSASGLQTQQGAEPHESRIPVGAASGAASLYVRDIGKGPAVIVLHGGPDFDHRYFLPDLDRLADSFHLIYYDQRGRGMSADHVQPSEVSLASDV